MSDIQAVTTLRNMMTAARPLWEAGVAVQFVVKTPFVIAPRTRDEVEAVAAMLEVLVRLSDVAPQEIEVRFA